MPFCSKKADFFRIGNFVTNWKIKILWLVKVPIRSIGTSKLLFSCMYTAGV